MSNFRIGQKVVCVWNDRLEAVLVRRHVYTIARTGFGNLYENRRVVGQGPHVWLCEIANPKVRDGHFRAVRFRPVKTTDISALTALLHPSPDDVVKIVEDDVDADMVEIIEAWSKSDA